MMGTGRSDAGLIDVLDRVLDKGVVIDAHVRVALVGVELLAVEARVVLASIETYLVHAETVSYTGLAARPAGMRDALPPAHADSDDESPTGVPPTGVPLLIAETIDVEPQPPIAIERADGFPEAGKAADADEAE